MCIILTKRLNKCRVSKIIHSIGDVRMSFVKNELLYRFTLDKISFFGNGVKQVELYKDGFSIQRKRDTENFSFEKVDKIIAKGYASPTPIYIYISIKLKSGEKDINFKLHPDLVDTNRLLGIHSDFLLGKDYS